MKSALIFPPQWFPSQPYLALPTLKAYLETKGHKVDQFDFNIESYEIFLSREYLTRCVKIIRARLDKPAHTPEEQEVQSVYRQILSDSSYLESIFSEVREAVAPGWPAAMTRSSIASVSSTVAMGPMRTR